MKPPSMQQIMDAVRTAYPGARTHFVIARLQLRTSLDFTADIHEPADIYRILDAMREICPDARIEE